MSLIEIGKKYPTSKNISGFIEIYEEYFNILHNPIKRIGSKNHPIPSSIELEKDCLPQPKDIEQSIKKLLKK